MEDGPPPHTIQAFNTEEEARRGREYSLTGPETYRTSFSGADFQITAVLPWEWDYQQQQSSELAGLKASRPQLLKALLATNDEVANRQLLEQIRATDQAIRRLEETQPSDNRSFLKTFASIQTLSLTTRRSVSPVRRMGEAFPAYYTRGPRTIAGSMLFIFLDETPLYDFHRRTLADPKDGSHHFVIDRIPPFNVLITGINEYGHYVEGALLGVTLLASGMTISIEDLFTEQQYTYVARSMIPLARRERHELVSSQVGQGLPSRGKGAASDLKYPRDSYDANGPLGKNTASTQAHQPLRSENLSNASARMMQGGNSGSELIRQMRRSSGAITPSRSAKNLRIL